MSSQLKPVCRICQGGGGDLITPCNCRGVFAFAHSSCVSRWVEATDLPYCDVCRFKYIADKKPKGFNDWRRLEGKTEQHFATFQQLCLSLFNLIIAGVLLMSTYGKHDSHLICIYLLLFLPLLRPYYAVTELRSGRLYSILDSLPDRKFPRLFLERSFFLQRMVHDSLQIYRQREP